MERRILSSATLRAQAYANGKRVLRGTAAAFGVPTRLGDFHEIIASGAFTRALKRGDDVRALINHDANLVLGRTTSGTLRLAESASGLDFDVTLPDTQPANDMFRLVERGDIDQCSFAFSVDGSEGEDWQDDWQCPDEEDCCGRVTPLRTLKNLRLFDVSMVTFPAYTKGTKVSALPAGVLASGAEDDDEPDDGEDPLTQYSVVVSPEARARARRGSRAAAVKQAISFADNLFKAQVRATRDLSRQ